MSESDLDNLLNDLDIPNTSEEDGSAEGGDELAATDDSGGEGIELDDDLAAMADSAEGDESGGEGIELDDDLAASLTENLSEGDGESASGAEADMSALAETLGENDARGDEEVTTSAIMGLAGIDAESVNVEFLLEIKLHVTFEVGRAKMLISDLLTLGQGSVIELHRLVGDELDFMINGKLVAKGEVVVVNEKFGCRISSIIPPEDRVKYLGGIF